MVMELELGARQRLVMTRQMRLAVRILQMNALDLELYIHEAALENPVLEIESSPPAEDPRLVRQEKLEWLDRMDDSNSFKYMLRPHEERETPLCERDAGETLSESLLLQLAGLYLPPGVERAARYLIGSLDENGYLTTPRERITAELGCAPEEFDEALEALQRMDPPGVGAAGLRECLLLQAARLEGASPVLPELIRHHLDALAKNRLDKLASSLGVPLDEVKAAREQLLTLNPKPGNGFFERGAVPYIRPDLFVVHFENSFQVIYNDYSQPKVEISAYYRELSHSADPETAAYLREKLQLAEALVASIEQRRSTVLGCAKAILARQMPFFEGGPGHLVPMTLANVAADLGVHSSTVSRAVSGKYLQSQWGVQRLSDFFSRKVSKLSGEKSQDMAALQIKRIIDREDPASPLSDQKIAGLLAAEGIRISRRTVAKYRSGAGIPPSSGRRRF